MSQSFVKGALIITIASLISKILGSVFRIPLQNIAGNEVFGIFTLVYPVYMAVLILSVAGIPLAISKLISEARMKKQEDSIKDIFLTAGILATLFGLISFVIIYLFSGSIASLLGGDYARLSLIIVSATLLVAPYMAVYRGYFQGFDTMTPTALSQVLEQLVRVFFILLFAFVLVQQGYGAPVVAGGVMVGSIIGAIASLGYLRWSFNRSGLKPKSTHTYTFATFKTWGKRILILSLPICVGALAMALVNFIDSITVPNQLRAIGYEDIEIAHSYGYYGRGLALVQIAVVFAQALILPIIPLITGAIANKDEIKTRRVTEQSIKFTHLTSWPAAIGLFALTVPLNFALFGDFEENALMAIVHISALFTAFAVLTTGILQGMNRSKESAWIVVIGSILKVVLNIIFIRNFGLIGVAWSTLIVYIVISSLNIWMMRKTIVFSLWKRSQTVFAFAAVVMGLIVSIPLLWMDPLSWSRSFAMGYVILMIIVGGAVYSVIVVTLKGLEKQELQLIPVVGKYIK